MKKMGKKGGFMKVLTLSLAIALLTGCGLSAFDASKYTKATLDALTKGEFEEYTVQTNSTKEEAQKTYESQIEREVQALLGSSYNSASDEMKQKYTDLIKKMYSKLKYEVGEKTDGENDSYNVPVSAEKMIVFKDVISETQDKITKNKKYSSMSTDEKNELSIEYLYEVLNDHVDNATYEKPKTVQVSVAPIAGNENTYQINSNDLTSLFEALIDLDALSASTK